MTEFKEFIPTGNQSYDTQQLILLIKQIADYIINLEIME